VSWASDPRFTFQVEGKEADSSAQMVECGSERDFVQKQTVAESDSISGPTDSMIPA
jgi:hypothetical protein